jgi:hypothetical protein
MQMSYCSDLSLTWLTNFYVMYTVPLIRISPTETVNCLIPFQRPLKFDNTHSVIMRIAHSIYSACHARPWWYCIEAWKLVNKDCTCYGALLTCWLLLGWSTARLLVRRVYGIGSTVRVCLMLTVPSRGQCYRALLTTLIERSACVSFEYNKHLITKQ